MRAACGCAADRASDQEFRNFKTAAARAPSQGWTPYWLGRNVSAGGLTFSGPNVGDIGSELTGGGEIVTYDALYDATAKTGGVGPTLL